MPQSGILCLPDPTGRELHWTERTPQAIGVFVLMVGLVLALQRHELTSANLGLVPICLILLPWVLDMAGWPRRLMREEPRFHYPLLVVWTTLVIGCVYWLSVSYYVNIDFAPFVVTVLIGEMAATAGAKFGAVVLAAGIVILLILTFANHFALQGQVIWSFGFAIGWLGGTAYRNQLRISTELAEAQTQLATRAAEEERRRLAREIHDLIAHSLAVTMLQISGARLALSAGDTDEAIAALGDAEAAGRAAMAEIHRTVGLLGSDGDGASSPPTPCASDLPELIEGFRRAGLDVRFSLSGELGGIPLAPGLAAYRVVQESLSNAVKHAPGARVNLDLQIGSGEVTIHIANPIVSGSPQSPPGGNGLRGMVERAELLGGSVGTSKWNGSWNVDAHIPWGEKSA
jgi:signal transduction histidine kinase